MLWKLSSVFLPLQLDLGQVYSHDADLESVDQQNWNSINNFKQVANNFI